jgi:predicted enzyme related to lactoylglutathione lyase
MRFSIVLLSLLALSLTGAAGAASPTWFDLITEDAAVAREFYGELFDWKFEKYSPTYSVASRDGRRVAGIAEIRGHLPDRPEDFWLLGVEVDDVDECVERARNNGGKVHREPKTASGHGRYAVIVDPQGAALSLWRPEEGTRARPRSTDDWVWTELWTDDPSTAVEFYKVVLGYDHRGMEFGGEIYHVFTRDEVLTAGVLKTPFEGVEPNWVPYILVDDVRTLAARALELGGRVLLEPRGKLGQGEVVLIADPSGAAFFAHESHADQQEGGAGS